MGKMDNMDNRGNIYYSRDNIYSNNSNHNKVFYNNMGKELDNTFDSPV